MEFINLSKGVTNNKLSTRKSLHHYQPILKIWNFRSWNMGLTNKMKPFECRICGKLYVTKGGMLRHIITHSGTRNFKCHICEMTFARKCILHMHMCTHSQEKNFHCKICSKRFRWKESLRLHLLAHTNMKNFRCELCGKTFKRKSSVRQHMIIHTGERNFKCEVCGKTFVKKFCLQRHRALHEKTPRQTVKVEFEDDSVENLEQPNSLNKTETISKAIKKEWVWTVCFPKCKPYRYYTAPNCDIENIIRPWEEITSENGLYWF